MGKKAVRGINRGLTKFNLGRGSFGEKSGVLFNVAGAIGEKKLWRGLTDKIAALQKLVSPHVKVQAPPVLHYLSKESNSGKGGSIIRASKDLPPTPNSALLKNENADR